jgi:hypothetical protein
MTHKIFFTVPFTTPVEPRHFASSVVSLRGYKAGVVAPVQPTSSRMISHHSSASFPTTEKKEENREIDMKKQEGVVELMGNHLVFPYVPWRSRVGPHWSYARAHAKSHESGVYDHGGVSYLSCARGFCISCSNGRVHHGVCGVLRVRIWCAFTSISPLAATILWLGAASLDSFGDPAYSGLRNPVRGLHGD